MVHLSDGELDRLNPILKATAPHLINSGAVANWQFLFK